MRKTLTFVLALLVGGCTGTTARNAPAAAPVNTTVSVKGSTPNSAETTAVLTTYPDLRPGSVRLAGDPDRVVEALPAVYEGMGIAVGTRDPENRVVGNQRLALSRRLGDQPLSRIVRCGNTAFGVPVADAHRVEMSVLTTVRAEGEGVVAETAVRAAARDPSVSGHAVQCTTTGWLEERIGQQLRERFRY